MTLKDANAQIRAVLFRGLARKVVFRLENGLEVLAFGDVTVYAPRGQYQIILREIVPRGVGALQLRFEQLKEKLRKEGLFDVAHKKPLPFLPRRIAVVTSPTGAAIRDILRTIGRRFPHVHIRIFGVRVQGEEAPPEIAAALEAINRDFPDTDVIILGRGGGSIEDLWAFNEEVVARAIFASEIPIISAVGHEIDFTIADFVADERAATPTAAAERVVPSCQDLLAQLAGARDRMVRALLRRAGEARDRLERIQSRPGLRSPLDRVRQQQQRVDDLEYRLRNAMCNTLARTREKLGGAAARLESLSPLNVLARGYSVTRRVSDGAVLTSPDDVAIGDRVETILRSGRIESVVEEKGTYHFAPSSSEGKKE